MAHHPRPHPHGATSVYGEKPPRKGRGLLLLLAALLLLGLLIAGLVLAASEDDDKASKQQTTTQQTQGGSGDEATGGAAAPAGAGSLTVAGESILPPPGNLSDRVGEQAEGKAVKVVKVAGQQGFWVGTSLDERVYVEFGAKAGVAEEGAEFKPKVGDTVNLTAEVRPAPEQPGRTLKIPAEEEDIITQQGVFLNAENVEPAS